MAKTIPLAEVEAHALELVNEVAEKQEEVVILVDGEPRAKIVPMTRRLMTLEELRAHGVTIRGDIVEPLYGDWDPEL